MEKNFEALTYVELERRRQEVLTALMEVEDEVSRRRRQGRRITRSTELDWVPQGSFAESRIENPKLKIARMVSPELGFNVHCFRAFLCEIAPGIQKGTDHSHGEAIKYYLSGRGQEVTEGEETIDVGPGDALFVPPNTWHSTLNTGEEPLRFFAVGQPAGTALPVPIFKRITR